MVDAAIPVPKVNSGNDVYFFSGIKYARATLKSGAPDEIVTSPSLIRSSWNTFQKAGWGAVDAVVGVPGVPNSFYVFLGGHYFRANIDTDKSLQDSFTHNGVKIIEGGWKRLVEAGFDTIDAGVSHPSDNDHIWFFRGTKTLKYTWSEDKVSTGPAPITSIWPSLREAGFDSVDAIVSDPSERDLFFVFRGDEYVKIRWRLHSKATLEKGPLSIQQYWPVLKGLV